MTDEKLDVTPWVIFTCVLEAWPKKNSKGPPWDHLGLMAINELEIVD